MLTCGSVGVLLPRVRALRSTGVGLAPQRPDSGSRAARRSMYTVKISGARFVTLHQIQPSLTSTLSRLPPTKSTKVPSSYAKTKMLLKQANPEHADSAPRIPDHHAMALDPSNPDATPDAFQNNNDILDDVFGGDDDHHLVLDAQSLHEQNVYADSQTHHPSDIPRLQQEHTTAGYRDGITVAKATSIQAGFDEGFGLGATIGLKVGRLLGLLEGIAAATKDEALLSDARAELGVKSVFGETFWDADGTWKYEVDEEESSSSSSSSPSSSSEAVAELLFSHIAEAHPLVKKWTTTVQNEMQRWGLQEQLPLLARHDDDDDDEAGGGRQVVLARAKATGQSQGEAKAPNDALSW